MSAAIYQGREHIRCAPDAPVMGIGIPCRYTSPPEFWLTLNQALPPLNVKVAYIVNKGSYSSSKQEWTPMLAAPSRNAILETALNRGIRYLLFLDDDVLFPDVTIYRLWGEMQLHPEAACITAVYSTKLPPAEPFLYIDHGSGAYWDWPLGCLVPIHSAGAGCMIVDLDYVRKLSAPWFNDNVSTGVVDGVSTRAIVGHDRYFHARLRDEAGGIIYADTGLLLAHMDTNTNRPWILPPEAPCFQRPPLGESFVPAITEEGVVMWTRLLTQEGNPQFMGYLQWLRGQTSQGSSLDLL